MTNQYVIAQGQAAVDYSPQIGQVFPYISNSKG